MCLILIVTKRLHTFQLNYICKFVGAEFLLSSMMGKIVLTSSKWQNLNSQGTLFIERLIVLENKLHQIQAKNNKKKVGQNYTISVHSFSFLNPP